jgi:hypothetical protein
MDTMDETLDELEGYVSYFEDVPAEWLKPGASRFTRIAERLQRLKESLDKQTTEEKEWS